MKKWKFLVASALLCGALTTVTSCIDNDEPAGISDLRGAKAEYIRAKTQWELASAEIEKVKVEREQVLLEQDKVALELQKLNLERQQAITAWQKDSLTAKTDSLKAAQEVVMKKIAKKLTDAEKSYQKALVDLQISSLTYKDEQFSGKIDEFTTALAIAREDLTKEVNNLFGKQAALMNFFADTTVYVKGLEMDIEGATQALAIQNQILTDLGGFSATPWTEWNTKLADVTKEIAEVNEDVVKRQGEINKMESEIQPVKAQIAEEKTKKLKEDKTFTVPADKVGAELQSDFGGVVSYLGFNDNFDKAFEENPDGTYTMIGDWTIDPVSLNDANTNFQTFLNQFERNYRSEFANAYQNKFYTWIPSNVDPTEAQIAKAKGELARMAVDKATAYTTFQADSTDWIGAYNAYKTALSEYKNYLLHNTYDAIQKEVDTYKDLDPAKQTADEAKKLQTALKAYYAVRNPLDGSEPMYPNDKGEEVKLSTLFADMDLAVFNGIINNWGDYSLLGGPNIATNADVYNTPDKNREGAVQRLIRASHKAFGTESSFSSIVEPKYVDNKPYLPEDVTVNQGNPSDSYSIYMSQKGQYDIFANIEKWIALDGELESIGKVLEDQLQVIENSIATLEASIADKQDAIWKAEFEVKLLDNTQAMSDNNIYSSAATGVRSKKQALVQLQTTIENAINNQGTITYVTYNATTKQFETNEGTIEKLIEDQKTTILAAERALAQAQLKLEKFRKMGLKDEQYQKTLELEIADQQLKVDEYQAAVDRLNATLKEFLAAYGGEE